MDLTLRHISKSKDGIFSNIFDINNDLFCVAAERAFLSSDGYVPAIPDGIWICQRRFSPKFQYDVFEVLNVPGHKYIEIHIANYPQLQLEGCIAVGTTIDNLMITESEKAFHKLMALQEGLNTFQLTVK